jgi:hypothetical protein
MLKISGIFFVAIFFIVNAWFVEKCIIQNNFSFANATVHCWNSSDQISIGIFIEYKFDISKFFMYLKINVPKDDKDKEYQRELFKWNIDINPATLKRISNPALKATFGDSFNQFISQFRKFPIKKVRKVCFRT